MRAPLYVMVVGPVSPPITGRVIITQYMVAEFAESGLEAKVFDVSRRLRWRYLRKAGKFFAGSMSVVRNCLHKEVVVYLPLDSDKGIFLDIFLLAVARVFASRTVVHHHTYKYVNVYDRRMAALSAIGGRSVLHVTLCESMTRQLMQIYPHVERVAEISNSAWVEREKGGFPRKAIGRIVKLGFLSNLTIDKGIMDVVRLIKALIDSGVPASLDIAGPFASEEARLVVQHAARSFPGVVRYLGPVYKDRKEGFFKNIDVFIYPTRDDAEPVVVLEAMSRQIPVIAYGAGCIPDRVPRDGKMVIPVNQDFVERAVALLHEWIRCPYQYMESSKASSERLDSLREQARRGVRATIEYIRGGGKGGFRSSE